LVKTNGRIVEGFGNRVRNDILFWVLGGKMGRVGKEKKVEKSQEK